jgi:hypothetical protein
MRRRVLGATAKPLWTGWRRPYGCAIRDWSTRKSIRSWIPCAKSRAFRRLRSNCSSRSERRCDVETLRRFERPVIGKLRSRAVCPILGRHRAQPRTGRFDPSETHGLLGSGRPRPMKRTFRETRPPATPSSLLNMRQHFHVRSRAGSGTSPSGSPAGVARIGSPNLKRLPLVRAGRNSYSGTLVSAWIEPLLSPCITC